MNWKVNIVTICLAILSSTTNGENTKAGTTIKSTTTTTKPIVKTKDSELCKKCTCDIGVLLLDCRNKSMTAWFNDDDWNTLTNGDVSFETIRLENNNLTNIPVLKAMPVKNLYLGHNLISKIENAAFHSLFNLTILDLSYNNLTSKTLRPEAFQGNYNPENYEPLPNMIELDLGHNELHSLDSDLFEHLPKLEILILGSNEFQVIDHLTETAIAGLPNLKTLDLSYMELKDLPNNMLHSPADLEILILSGNLFNEIPNEIKRAKNLKKLTLDDNPLGSLEGENVFTNLTKLEYLSISYSNDLVKIGEGAFSSLKNLKTLVLASNPNLTYIHPKAFSKPTVNPMIFDFPSIEELFLHNNNLTFLDHELLVRWDKVKTIDLRMNPWACDCKNSWLINVLMTQIESSNDKLVHDVTCGTPAAWKSTPIIQLNKEKKILRCSTDSHPENDGSLLIGLLIGILIGIPVTFGAIILYRRGCFGITNRGSRSSALYNRASFTDDFHI